MKRIFFIALSLFLICIGTADAGPWISTPPTNSQITGYLMTVNGGAAITVPVHTNSDGSVMFAYDVGTLNLANGNHTITVQGINSLWGLQTNVFPFELEKPASLEEISDITLSSDDPRQ